MTTIEDLGYKSISDMTIDEAIEHLRQIRLSRRVPVKKVSSKRSSSKPKPKPKLKSTPNLTPEQAKKLLDLIGGK